MVRMPEIELAFCNACTADCYICSKTHGGHNNPLMSWEVYQAAAEQMQEVDFDIVQTGGDGDSFLNKIYIDALRDLKIRFPKKKIVLYTNFANFTHQLIDIVVNEQLVSEVNTRVDTLAPALYQACTGLDMDEVFDNIDYWISRNTKIPFNINYASIQHYKSVCNEVLGKDPYYWQEIMGVAIDEYEWVKDRFTLKSPGVISRIKTSLWAERNDPAIEPCDCDCQRQYCFDSTMYIWTDGDVGICGYDDGQDALVYGNILKTPIKRLWVSEERQVAISKVRNREIKGYPCVNPRACLFY